MFRSYLERYEFELLTERRHYSAAFVLEALKSAFVAFLSGRSELEDLSPEWTVASPTWTKGYQNHCFPGKVFPSV